MTDDPKRSVGARRDSRLSSVNGAELLCGSKLSIREADERADIRLLALVARFDALSVEPSVGAMMKALFDFATTFTSLGEITASTTLLWRLDQAIENSEDAAASVLPQIDGDVRRVWGCVLSLRRVVFAPLHLVEKLDRDGFVSDWLDMTVALCARLEMHSRLDALAARALARQREAPSRNDYEAPPPGQPDVEGRMFERSLLH